jgi:hypothetical protein
MRQLFERHPNLMTWLGLAVGMEVILVWSARDQEFTAQQWWWLSFATVVLAGACAWIISWEADEPDGGWLGGTDVEDETSAPAPAPQEGAEVPGETP